jgi:hypothetical protein
MAAIIGLWAGFDLSPDYAASRLRQGPRLETCGLDRCGTLQSQAEPHAGPPARAPQGSKGV